MGVYLRGQSYWIEFIYKKKRYRQAIGPDKKVAEDVLAQRKVEIRENRFFPDKQKEPEPINFHDFAKQYFQWAKANKKHSTCVREIYIIRVFDREFGKKNLNEITTWQIEKWRSKRRETCQVASVNRELSLIKHIFSKAVEWKDKNQIPFLRQDPAKGVKYLKGETKRMRFLMPDEIQMLLSNCGNLLEGILEPIVTVALHTGMRKHEILELEWNRINFQQGLITLLNTKNNQRRDVPMDETVKTTLLAIDRKENLVFMIPREEESIKIICIAPSIRHLRSQK